jgi:hypothetical protein
MGYRIDRENKNEILHRSMCVWRRWRDAVDDLGYFTEPEEIDPREFWDVWSQGNQGSCQGQSLADSVAYCHYLDTGVEEHISRGFAYLASQEYDGLIGRDQGSTLSGGTKAVLRGIPLESVFPYSENYNSQYARYQQQKSTILADEDELYKLRGEVPLSTEEDCKKFLSTHSGIIHIGIMWGLPDAWEIANYSPGGGGHAVSLAGYLKVRAWGGYGYLLKNSWGQGWGKNGWALIHPQAITQMLKARFTVFIGRSGPETPEPKPSIDL